jgi:hypothetical protein
VVTPIVTKQVTIEPAQAARLGALAFVHKSRAPGPSTRSGVDEACRPLADEDHGAPAMSRARISRTGSPNSTRVECAVACTPVAVRMSMPQRLVGEITAVCHRSFRRRDRRGPPTIGPTRLWSRGSNRTTPRLSWLRPSIFLATSSPSPIRCSLPPVTVCPQQASSTPDRVVAGDVGPTSPRPRLDSRQQDQAREKGTGEAREEPRASGGVLLGSEEWNPSGTPNVILPSVWRGR